MKKKIQLSILFFLLTAFFLNAQDRHAPGTGYENGNGHYSHGNGNGYGHTGAKPGSVGAPLDGGLLLILGGAGVAYYSTRKRKRNN